MIKKTRAFICGISGHNLKKSEVSFPVTVENDEHKEWESTGNIENDPKMRPRSLRYKTVNKTYV